MSLLLLIYPQINIYLQLHTNRTIKYNIADNLKENIKDNLKDNFKDNLKDNIKYNIKTTSIEWDVTSA